MPIIDLLTATGSTYRVHTSEAAPNVVSIRRHNPQSGIIGAPHPDANPVLLLTCERQAQKLNAGEWITTTGTFLRTVGKHTVLVIPGGVARTSPIRAAIDVEGEMYLSVPELARLLPHEVRP